MRSPHGLAALALGFSFRVAEAVYQRLDRHTGQPVPGKFEFTYRDSTGRQRWQTAKGDTRADAKAERAEMLARLHRGERVERSSRTVGEVAEAWLERIGGRKAPGTRPRASGTSVSSGCRCWRPPTRPAARSGS